MNAIVNPSLPQKPLLTKTLVLVGMPGAGKSCVGKRLAAQMGVPFVDSDSEVETAAGMKINQIFERLGEPAFRQGERRVIARLMEGAPHVLATGGGAFMDEDSRALIRQRGVSVWLRVPLEILLERTSRHHHRPLLRQADDPAVALRALLAVREPVYATADIVVDSDHRPAEETVHRVQDSLNAFLCPPLCDL